MTTIINSSTYQNGNRVVSQTVTYTLSDDILHLAQLQSQLGHVIKRIEELRTAEPSEGITQEINRLSNDRTNMLSLIQAQQAIVDGYEGQ